MRDPGNSTGMKVKLIYHYVKLVADRLPTQLTNKINNVSDPVSISRQSNSLFGHSTTKFEFMDMITLSGKPNFFKHVSD